MFFTPKYVKEARQLAKGARKLLAYRCDLWSDVVCADFRREIEALEKATKTRDEKAVEEAAGGLNVLCNKHAPVLPNAGWRENCEVVLVALVIAVGIRAYFLQPFKIPTGSMQPTLNGIIGHKLETPMPGPLRRALDLVVLGRTYVDVVSPIDDEIVEVEALPETFFGSKSRITTARGNSFVIPAPTSVLAQAFGVYGRTMFRSTGSKYKAGEPIVRGYVDTGDQVFVDKFTYHFRAPQRGDVFVFRTTGIRGIEQNFPPGSGSQFYIKRLAGVPGDLLKIDTPKLYVNDGLATAFGMERVMSLKNGYHGYVNEIPGQSRFQYLSSPLEPFTLGDHAYFALGDNSLNSLDSRAWGIVPEKNIVGRGLLVYWPFNNHWGLIR